MKEEFTSKSEKAKEPENQEIFLTKLIELYDQADAMYASGKCNEALLLTEKIRKLGKKPFVYSYTGGLLVSIGEYLKNEKIVSQAISDLKKFLKLPATVGDHVPYVYYNLARGYSVLYNLKRRKNPTIGLFQASELQDAREYYLKAIECNPKDNTFLSQIWTNLGNCHDASGRVLDAIDCYDKALEYTPEFGMALGNKGIALKYYAVVTGVNELTFFYEAYLLIKRALEIGVDPGTKEEFQSSLSWLLSVLKENRILENPPNFPGCKIKRKDQFEEFLIEFCLENKLYLNLCNTCQNCDKSIGDPVTIKKMTISLKSSTGQIGSYFSLASYLNHIKQDYITARFLLIQSQYEGLNISFVDKKVKIIDPLDYSTHNIYIGLVKTAFRSFYDILDKISIFINDYLQLEIPINKVSFKNVWYEYHKKENEKDHKKEDKKDHKKEDKKKKIIHHKMREKVNFPLNAIYDIFLEFENGRYNKLRKTRNALTHRFVNIRIIQEIENEENMLFETLINQTIELAKIVRNVIIYLMNFIHKREVENAKSVGPDLPQIEAFEINDDQKGYR